MSECFACHVQTCNLDKVKTLCFVGILFVYNLTSKRGSENTSVKDKMRNEQSVCANPTTKSCNDDTMGSDSIGVCTCMVAYVWLEKIFFVIQKLTLEENSVCKHCLF